jgi:heme/copper-type cytochrome/quinol oxidase subunit 3
VIAVAFGIAITPAQRRKKRRQEREIKKGIKWVFWIFVIIGLLVIFGVFFLAFFLIKRMSNPSNVSQFADVHKHAMSTAGGTAAAIAQAQSEIGKAAAPAVVQGLKMGAGVPF